MSSYVITNSRGLLVAVVPEGTVNTTATSLSLVGQGVLNYGTAEIENYIYLLENFAAPSAPVTPVLGQLWYDSNADTMKVWTTGNTWLNIADSTSVAASIEAAKISPAFLGVPTAPTPPSGTANTQIATTAFVTNSPQFTGVPTAPTPGDGTANTQIATTAFVASSIVSLSGNISGVLGNMAFQNANAVSITGGTISGIDLGGLTGVLTIAQGGTNATNAPAARINLGLGTMATQNANAVAITGGTISGVAFSNASGIIPAGIVVMWSGSAIAIPTGWVLCNGANGTPDLRDKFVVGAGFSYAVNAQGGSKDAVLVAHTHTITDPGHNHTYQRREYKPNLEQRNDPGGGPNLETAFTGSSQTGITINSAGTSGVNANLPPYYALCYIMKT